MRFKHDARDSFPLQDQNPLALSDEAAEFYYQRALREAEDFEPYPPGSAGRLAVASQFVRLLQQYYARKP